ncbi:MAG: 4-amino-4-deoxy-L-arabinose-phosphoundecaprenol flippase subunit ArnF [Candidatus Anoxychlamydiales bacterium]|nr:4-amino-4-deoxy-L-arabinose-phosphoundecaprenol flippase subunit ArnF [Candidatus Anoxychlamydiales bacterium]
MHIYLLFFSIIIASCAQILFKFYTINQSITPPNGFLESILNIKLIAGFFLYFCSSILYILALKNIDLSIAYPTIAVSYILIIVLSFFIFKESISLNKIIGIILITLGVSFLWK